MLFDEFPVHPLAEPSPVSSPFQHIPTHVEALVAAREPGISSWQGSPDWSLDHPGSQKADVECGRERGWTTLLHGVSHPWEGIFGAMREMQTDSPSSHERPWKHGVGVGVATHHQVSIRQIFLESCSQCKHYQSSSKPNMPVREAQEKSREEVERIKLLR